MVVQLARETAIMNPAFQVPFDVDEGCQREHHNVTFYQFPIDDGGQRRSPVCLAQVALAPFRLLFHREDGLGRTTLSQSVSGPWPTAPYQQGYDVHRAVENHTDEPIGASSNPGKGQGSGDQVQITIPPQGKVDRWNPTPEGVSDVDYMEGPDGKPVKVSGTDYAPRWHCYSDGGGITCTPTPPWVWCLFHSDSPSCKKKDKCGK